MFEMNVRHITKLTNFALNSNCNKNHFYWYLIKSLVPCRNLFDDKKNGHLSNFHMNPKKKCVDRFIENHQKFNLSSKSIIDEYDISNISCSCDVKKNFNSQGNL